MSRSGYYDWVKRKPCFRIQEDIELGEKIRRIHSNSRMAYGSPRVHRALRIEGVRVGEKRVARLMKDSGLQGRVVTVTRRAPKLKQFQQSGENLRLKVAEPTRCNEQWVADLTYIKVASDYWYLITIMDICSRKILGWSLSKSRTVSDVLPVLERVIKRRAPTSGMIFHTDRGIEFMAYAVQDVLKEYGIRPSYNRAGNCTDNAHMESFYHSLKGELIRGRKFNNELELRVALSSYIDGFYNRTRLHSGIGYTSPNEYEARAA